MSENTPEVPSPTRFYEDYWLHLSPLEARTVRAYEKERRPVTDTVLPYDHGTTTGWSGSDASRERAEEESTDGTATIRQRLVLNLLDEAGGHGMTWREVASATGWHHGQATGALSNLHKGERVERLTEKRNRCSVYVGKTHVYGRETVPHGRRRPQSEFDREEGFKSGILCAIAAVQESYREHEQPTAEQVVAEIMEMLE